MRRGEIWIGSGSGDYSGKPRPHLIVQADHLFGFESIITCPITSTPQIDGWTRLRVEPGERSGLRETSWVMVDKVGAIQRPKFGKQVGIAEADLMAQVSAGLIALLDLGA